MKKIIPLLLSIFALAITGCSNVNNSRNYGSLSITGDANKRVYLVGEDFDPTGLEVYGLRKDCKCANPVNYSLENDQDLQLDQTSVTIKFGNLTLNYGIKVVEKYHIACVGDSLTAGHYWANEAYPVYLQEYASDEYLIENCGVNGISITGYGGSWDDPSMQYIKQDVYQKSVNFSPDIFAIMLGTNDATGWEKAKDKFYDQYCELLDSYIELFPYAKFIMMVSPPVVSPNQFNIPNEEIKNYVNPIQRELAEEYEFELLDLRKEFEDTPDYQSKFLRPNNDNVHFTKEGAQFVASRVWEIAQNLYF